jgi:predicted transposase YbfD/YdcC
MQKVETSCASQHPTSTDTSVTAGRNRHETRTAEIFSAALAVAATEWEPLIKDIVRVTREVLHRNAKTGLWSSTSEVAYYVTDSPTSAHDAACAIRGHWHIENTLHYTRDVTFQEDHSRIRHNPGVFARLRSFAYNILRRNKTSTFSQDRYAAALAGFNALFKWRLS